LPIYRIGLISRYLSQAKITYVEYSFWPKLKNNREPDVALLFHFDSEVFLLILVEAKYFSGISDWEGDEEANPYGLAGNQIADQGLWWSQQVGRAGEKTLSL